MENNCKKDMLEQEYLELVNQLQQKFNENETKLKDTEKKIMRMKRDLSVIYGLVRSMDSTIIGGIDLPDEFCAVWDLLSTNTQDISEKHLFSGRIEGDNYDEILHIDVNFNQ